MATKLVQLLQKESGPFTTTNNLASVDFEPGNVTDLSKSYIHMELEFTSQTGEVLPEGRVYLGEPETECKYDAACFVKHATLRSDTMGLIEQQRFVNIYNESMKQFTMSTEEEKASVALGNNEVVLDANGTGHVIFPLSKILGSANAETFYPDYKMGQTRLELEFEDKEKVAYIKDIGPTTTFTLICDAFGPVDEIQNIVVTQPFKDLLTVALYITKGRTYTLEYEVENVGQDPVEVVVADYTFDEATKKLTLILDEPVIVPDNSNITNINIGSIDAADSFACEDVAGGAAATQVTVFKALDALPGNFLPGLPLTVGFLVQTSAGLDPADDWQFFTSILKSAVIDIENPTDVILTLDKPFTIPAGKELNDVFTFGYGAKMHVEWKVNKLYLVQAKPVKQQQVDSFVFQTQLLEQVNHPAVNEFRRQVELEENVDLVVAINPLKNTLLGNGQFNEYRNSVNSVDTITKDIVISNASNGSLYHDRLMYAIDDLKRLQRRNGVHHVAIYPERITPEQALIPQNVIEFRFANTSGLATEAGMWYFYKRLTKVF